MRKTKRKKQRKTKVVNVSDDYDVFIGRPSKWGNPYMIGRDGNRAAVIEKYRIWLMSKTSLMAGLGELEGKRLGCFCAPKACHGGVLVELIERIGR